MYPNILGFEDSSYLLFIILGIIAALSVALIMFKRKKLSKAAYIDLIICTCFAVALGIVFAVLFQNLYEFFENPSKYTFVFKMTFFGGLFGGAIGFLLTYFLISRKGSELDIKIVLIVAPICITLAHGFGRIGCFLAGCCYGKPTDSWIGITFPQIGKVIPTQLIECIFLFLLSIVLAIFTFKKECKYNISIYLISYSIFRFIIEFFRDDPRGGFKNFVFSPSQIWCLILFILGIILIFIFKYKIFKGKENAKKETN